MSKATELAALKLRVRQLFAAARAEGLWIGAGRDGSRPATDDHQYGPLAKKLLEAASE